MNYPGSVYPGEYAVGGTTAFALRGTGYVNVNAFGNALLEAQFNATGYANAQAFGSTSLNGRLTASGFANAQAFGSHEVRAQFNAISYVNANAFGGAALNGQLGASGYVNTSLFGSHSLQARLQPQGFENNNDFGRALLDIGPKVIYGGGYLPYKKLTPLWAGLHYLVSRSLINEQRFGEARIGAVVLEFKRRQKQQRQLATLCALRLAA